MGPQVAAKSVLPVSEQLLTWYPAFQSESEAVTGVRTSSARVLGRSSMPFRTDKPKDARPTYFRDTMRS